MSEAGAYQALEAALWAEIKRLWADAPSDGAHDLGHLARVLAMAKQIAATEGGDLEVLIPAALLHDAVNLPKSAPNRAEASRLSAKLAETFLERRPDYPKEKIAACAHAIAAHSYSAGIKPQTQEARILQDADRLDALGALGLARMFHVAGQMGAALFHPEDPLAQSRPLNDRLYALDHIEVKLIPLVDGLHSPLARRIAQERIALMRGFRAQVLQEIELSAKAPGSPLP